MNMNSHENQDLPSGNEEDNCFSEDILRQLCKTLRAIIPRHAAGIEEHTLIYLQSLHQGLLRTANSTRLSFAHGAAALNALCAFIEQCNVSSVPELRNLSFSSATWTKAFKIILERSQRHKSKPLRRLLMTLTDILSKHEQDDVKFSLIGHVVTRATRAICGQPDTASIKPAIQALEHFIHVGLTTAQDVVNYAIEASGGSQAISVAGMDSLVEGKTESTSIQRDKTVENFAMSVLGWVQFPDCAPAAGRFLSVFFQSLNAESSNQGVSDETAPLWINPVKQIINNHPELFEEFEHHVLPGLLILSPTDNRAFLRTLPLWDITRGNAGADAAANIQLCFLIAKVAASLKIGSGSARENESTLANVFANSRGQNGTEEQESFLIDSEALACNHLEHSSASVRLSALSLLISSSVTSRPFTQRALENLRICIPYFHVEVNPKARNEYIAMMQKLCLRIRLAIMSFLRADKDSLEFGFEESSTSKTVYVAKNTAGWETREQMLRAYLVFRKRYLLFLLHELRPTASYQSHITALRILHPLLGGKWASQVAGNYNYLNALDEALPWNLFYQPLYDLLLDPFDDVRQWAAMVIQLCIERELAVHVPSPAKTIEEKTDKADLIGKVTADAPVIGTVLQMAEKKAKQTGRADHADGVGRLYELLYLSDRVIVESTKRHYSSFSILDRLISEMEKDLKVAKDDLLQVIGNASLHGHLIALRHIVSHPDYFATLDRSTNSALDWWRKFTERIHLICSDVWEVVRHTLCFDAPEGHEIDEEVDDVDIGTKDVLSFCWRALKESSALLHAIIANKGYGLPPSDGNGLSYEDYRKVGTLSFSQLAQLRHRGAFSTVSQTFSACCTACAGSGDPDVPGLVKNWYHDALACMELNASALTRRSAGIPAMITGILAAYAGHAFFNDVVLDLQAIADGPILYVEPEEVRLPQVHALNCLKDIFTDARFGPRTEVHVANTVDIAASCLESPVWAIRNCGLMLFKALVRRLNGGTDTASTKIKSSYRHSSSLTYQRYPNVPSLLLNLLCNELPLTTKSVNIAQHDGYSVMRVHRVFPAMELLETLGLPNECGEMILEAIWQYMESFDWAIREKAAKTLSRLLDVKDLISDARKLLSPDWPSQNALHGRILCLQHLLSRDDIPLIGYEELVPLIYDRCKSMVVQYPCLITVAAFLNVLAEFTIILAQKRSQLTQSIFDQMKLLSRPTKSRTKDLEGSSATALQSSASRRCLSLSIYLESLGKPLHQLSTDDLDTMTTLDEATKDMSDEHFLALLRIVPPHHLQYQLNVTRAARIPLADVAYSVHETHLNLAVSGYDLGLSYRESQEEKFSQRISTWVHMLFVSGSEESELLSRAATAYSLQGFFDGMRDSEKNTGPESVLLGPYMVLYNTLLDDDEDIRAQGSRIVSSLLSTHTDAGVSLSAAAAKSKFLDFLAHRYRGSRALFEEATRKLTGLSSMFSATSHRTAIDNDDDPQDVPLQLRPVAELSLAARTTQIAVFVEEKQNLFIDEVMEADAWANLLVHMDPEAWEPTVVSTLESWTAGGLQYLLDFCEDVYDLGASSPMSIPQMYTLFMRVILSAKVLIIGATQLGSRKIATKQEFRVLLEKLLELGTQKRLHGLLLDRVQYILNDEPHPTERL